MIGTLPPKHHLVDQFSTDANSSGAREKYRHACDVLLERREASGHISSAYVEDVGARWNPEGLHVGGLPEAPYPAILGASEAGA